MSVQVVDTIESVAKLADAILNLPVSPPSLYFDLEGIKLSRYGSISLLNLYVLPSGIVYIVDVHKLGAAAFCTEGDAKQSLKATLESEAIPKVFFDVRNDSDALHCHFQVSLAGIEDLQLMEVATRNGSKRLLNGLTNCIFNDSGLEPSQSFAWRLCKSVGIDMFAPEKGGSFEVFNERPLREAIVEYCAQDVILLPKLWSTYDSKLSPEWRASLTIAIHERIVKSQSPGYVPHGKHMALGPW